MVSVFSKDLQWSFIVVNADVLNTSLSSKPSNAYKSQSKQSLGVGLNYS